MSKYLTQNEFHNDLALVKNQNGLFGYINRENKEVISCQYDEAFDFQNDKAIVAEVKSYGTYYNIINTKGKEITKSEYDDVEFLHKDQENNTFLLCKKGKFFGVINQNNVIIIPFEYQHIDKELLFNKYLVVSKTNTDYSYGLVDFSHNVVLPLMYFTLLVPFVHKDTFIVTENQEDYFIVNAKNEIISEKYHHLYLITQNLCQAIEYKNQESNNPYTLLNPQTMKPYIDESFCYTEEFFDHTIAEREHIFIDNIVVGKMDSEKEEMYGIFSIKENKMIVPLQYDFIVYVLNRTKATINVGKRMLEGLIDNQNNILIKPEYDEIIIKDEDSELPYICAYKGDEFALFDINGKVLLPLQNDAEYTVSKKNGKINISTERTYCIDTKGDVLPTLYKYKKNKQTQDKITPPPINILQNIDQTHWEFEYRHTHKTQKAWKEHQKQTPERKRLPESTFMENRYNHKTTKNLILKNPQNPFKPLSFLSEDMMGFEIEGTKHFQITDLTGKILQNQHPIIGFGAKTSEDPNLGFINGFNGFINGYCVVQVEVEGENFYNIIDKQGNYILPMEHKSIVDVGKNAYIITEKKKQSLMHIFENEVCNNTLANMDKITVSEWGIITEQSSGRPKIKRTEIIHLQGKGLKSMPLSFNNDFEVVKMGKEGIWYKIIDENQEVHFGLYSWGGYDILKPIYDEMDYDFSEGFLRICINEKWGFLNEQEKIAIAPQFDDATPFRNGISEVTKREEIIVNEAP